MSEREPNSNPGQLVLERIDRWLVDKQDRGEIGTLGHPGPQAIENTNRFDEHIVIRPMENETALEEFGPGFEGMRYLITAVGIKSLDEYAREDLLPIGSVQLALMEDGKTFIINDQGRLVGHLDNDPRSAELLEKIIFLRR